MCSGLFLEVFRIWGLRCRVSGLGLRSLFANNPKNKPGAPYVMFSLVCPYIAGVPWSNNIYLDKPHIAFSQFLTPFGAKEASLVWDGCAKFYSEK